LIEKIARLENELAMHKTFMKQSYEEDPYGLNKKIQNLEVEKIRLAENNEYLAERVRMIEASYNNLKDQLDDNIAKYEDLLNKVKDTDDDKEKYAMHAKKLHEDLKNLNKSYVNLQKKVTQLEKENKELAENLKTAEAEKKSYAEKWLKLSKKAKNEDLNKTSFKALELEISEKTKELEEYREKFVSANAELQVLKESEKAYKEVIEKKSKELKELQDKFEADAKDKEILLHSNLELIDKLEKLQQEQATLSRKSEQGFKDREEINRLRNSVLLLQKTIKQMEVEKSELSKKLIELTQENDKLYKKKMELEQASSKAKMELQYANTKWQLLVKEYERFQEDHKKILNDYKSENDLIDNLQKKLTDRDEFYRPSSMLAVYDSHKDDKLLSLKKEIEKIEKMDETLFHSIFQALDEYVVHIKHMIDSNPMNSKYNRLLVKYYKGLERIKELEKLVENKDIEPFDPNFSVNSCEVSGVRSELKSRSVGKERKALEEILDKTNQTIKLKQSLGESFDTCTPGKTTTLELETRSSSTEKKSRGSLNRLIAERLASASNHSSMSLLKGIQTPSTASTKSLLTSKSVERLGTRKGNRLETEPASTSNSKYKKLLKKTLGNIQEKGRPSVGGRSSSKGRSYQDLHLSKKEHQVTQSLILSGSIQQLANIMTNHFRENNKV